MVTLCMFEGVSIWQDTFAFPSRVDLHTQGMFFFVCRYARNSIFSNGLVATSVRTSIDDIFFAMAGNI